MARSRDRIFALTLAIVFFVTSFGLSFLVIWQVFFNNKEAKTVNDSGVNDTSVNSNAQGTPQTQTPPANALQGTKLSGFEPTTSIGELKIEDQKAGDGDAVEAHANVKVDYTGAVAATGVIFQSSLDTGQPVTLSLDNVITGWKDGLVGMKVGGTRRLLIPAAQAYGANPPSGSGIPANADLVFDITLHEIVK